MICTVCIRPEVGADRELLPKHFCLSRCTIRIWGRVCCFIVWAQATFLCTELLMNLINVRFPITFLKPNISWFVTLLQNTTIVQLFSRDHSKNKVIKEKKHILLGSWDWRTFTWRLSQVSQRKDPLKGVQIKGFIWEYQHRIDDGWNVLSDGKALCSQGFS